MNRDWIHITIIKHSDGRFKCVKITGSFNSNIGDIIYVDRFRFLDWLRKYMFHIKS